MNAVSTLRPLRPLRCIRVVTACAAPALAVAMLAGCASQQVSDVNPRPREEITFAARAHYPGYAQTSDRVQAMAVDLSGDHKLEIYNLSDNAIPQSALWVNGLFVRQIDGIAPHGHLTVDYGDLIQAGAGTADLRQAHQTVDRVELQTPEGLFKVLGPGRK